MARKSLAWQGAWVGLCMWIAACAPEKGHIAGGDLAPGVVGHADAERLGTLLASTTTPEASRKRADELLVQAKGAKDEKRLALLEAILYEPGQSDGMRMWALDRLVEADRARALRAMGLYLPKWEGAVLEHGCEVAGTLRDLWLGPALLRSLDRLAVEPDISDVDIRAQPEWSALERVEGLAVEGAAFSVVVKGGDTGPRVAALDVLQKVRPRAGLMNQLRTVARQQARGDGNRGVAGDGGGDRWLTDTLWWLGTFGSMPVGENESRWVELLHRPEQAEMVSRALPRHEALMRERGPRDYAASPRYVAALSACDDADVRMTRLQLLAELERELAGKRHVRREPSSPGGIDDVDESLAANERKLSHGDLLVMRLVVRELKKPETIGELRRQGQADMSDKTTEHGGLVAVRDTGGPVGPVGAGGRRGVILEFRPYAPQYADNDFEYVTGDKLLQEAALGVAMYHFHFQQVRNEAVAGPGAGDMRFAHAARANCVVITSVGPREMDVDYYTGDGAVVDLGVWGG